MLKLSCIDSPRAASLLSLGAKAVLTSERGTRYMCSAGYKGVEVNERLASFMAPVEIFSSFDRLKSVVELDESLSAIFRRFNKGELIVLPEGRGLGVTLLEGGCFAELFKVSEPLYGYPLKGSAGDLDIVKLEGPDFMLVESPFADSAEPSVISAFGGEWSMLKEGLVSLAELRHYIGRL